MEEVVYRGNKKMTLLYFNSLFGRFRNSEVTLDELQDAIRHAYGSGFFENITYSLETNHGKTNLVIETTEAGPGAVSAGIHYDSDYGIILSLTGAFRNILSRNSKLFTELNVAVNPRIRIRYLAGLGGKSAFGVDGEFYTFMIDLYEKDAKVNNLNLTNYKTSLFFNYYFRNSVTMKAGFDYEYFRFRQDIVIDSSLMPMETFTGYGTLFFSLNADNRDKVCYATRGIRAMFRAEYVFPVSKNWSKEVFTNTASVYLKFEDNISLNRKFVLRPGLFTGATIHDQFPPIQHWFGVGGLAPDNYIATFVPFTGLNFVQHFGFYSWIGRMNLQYNVYNKLYVNLRADVGATEMTMDEVLQSRNVLAGYGITASYNSFIGPLEFSVMGSNLNKGLMFYLNLGYWF